MGDVVPFPQLQAMTGIGESSGARVEIPQQMALALAVPMPSWVNTCCNCGNQIVHRGLWIHSKSRRASCTAAGLPIAEPTQDGGRA